MAGGHDMTCTCGGVACCSGGELFSLARVINLRLTKSLDKVPSREGSPPSCIAPTASRACAPPILVNIPGWVATVIKQAVLLFGCCHLHFWWRPSSAGPQWGSAHSKIFGSGGKMRLRVDPPSFSLHYKKKHILYQLSKYVV